MVILRWLLAGVLGFVGLPLCVALFGQQLMRFSDPPRGTMGLIIGAVLGVVMIATRKPNWFAHTFIHESAHALLCILLRVPIREFHVTDGAGGLVKPAHTDAVRWTIILLAPYTLPLVLGPILLARWFFPWQGWQLELAQGVLTFAYAHHMHGLWHNVRLNFWGKESDLAKASRPLSLVVIACVQLLLATAAIHLAYL